MKAIKTEMTYFGLLGNTDTYREVIKKLISEHAGLDDGYSLKYDGYKNPNFKFAESYITVFYDERGCPEVLEVIKKVDLMIKRVETKLEKENAKLKMEE